MHSTNRNLNGFIKRIRLASLTTMFLLPCTIHLPGGSVTAFSEDQSLVMPSTGPKIAPRKIRSISLHDGAALDILNAPVQFHNATAVCLWTETNNEHYIQNLTQNYPWINGLLVKQINKLSDKSVDELGTLKNLTKLTLRCPLVTPSSLSKLGQNLHTLSVYPEANVLESSDGVALELPLMHRLYVYGGKISDHTFERTHAPNLKIIHLHSVVVEKNSVAWLNVFPRLRQLRLYKTLLSDDQILALRKQHISVLVEKWR